jgi:hypothetical protein
MTFDEIKQTVSLTKNGDKLQFDLAWIDSKLSGQLDDFVKIEANTLHLHHTKIELDEQESINISGKIYLKGLKQILDKIANSNTFFEFKLILFNTEKPDYLISIEPNGDWEKKTTGAVKSILKAMPVSFKDIMFLHSSLDLKKATIAFDESRVFELGISKGMGIVAYVNNPLLDLIKLPNTLFQITRSEDGVYKVFKELNFETAIAGLFKLAIKKMQFLSKESIELETNITVPLPGGNIEVPAFLRISKGEYAATIKIEKNIKLPLPYFLAGDGINVGNIEMDLQGSFSRPVYTYGLYGNFAIGGAVLLQDASPNRDLLNDGNLRIYYNSTTQATLIPVFVEAFAKEITLSKIVRLYAGKIIELPKFLDEIARFYSAYFYYCEPGQARVLVNGVKAKQGIALSSGVNILGLEAYAEFTAIEQRTTGNITLEPIKLAGLVEISGDGTGSPPKYTGPAIQKGGVQLYFDSDGPIFFRTDVKVKLFNAFEFKTGANIQEKGLQFYYNVNLGFARARIDCLLNSIDDFSFSSSFDAKLLGVKADLGPLGQLSANLSVTAFIQFAIKFKTSDGMGSLNLGFNFNGNLYAIDVSFDIQNIKAIEEIAKSAIVDLITKLISDPLIWLEGILEGMINIAEDAIEKAKEIATKLQATFNRTVEGAIKLINQAGFKVDEAVVILKEGFNRSVEDAARLLKEAGYSVEQIGESLINFYKQPVALICSILNPLFSPQEIGNALKKYSAELLKELPALQQTFGDGIGLLLNGMGKTTAEAGQILKDVLNIGDNVVGDILRTAMFPVGEIDIRFPKVDVGLPIPIPIPIPHIPKCVKVFGKRICR